MNAEGFVWWRFNIPISVDSDVAAALFYKPIGLPKSVVAYVRGDRVRDAAPSPPPLPVATTHDLGVHVIQDGAAAAVRLQSA